MAKRLQPMDPNWLQEAFAIACALREEAITTDAGLRWIGDEIHGDSRENAVVVRGDTGEGLYSGSSGIGWFLAQLGKRLEDRPLEQFGRQALAEAVRCSMRGLHRDTLSLYSGASGVALSALQVSEALGVADLQAQAWHLAEAIATCLLEEDPPHALDLIGGVAGVMVCLAEFQRRSPSPTLAAACARAVARLRDSVLSHWHGSCWKDPHGPEWEVGLCGMAHGTSGIAWALFQWAELSQEEGLGALAVEALRYERAWFSLESASWADLRGEPHGLDWPGAMTAWCHGGIGIAALRLWLLHHGAGQAGLPPPGALLADVGAALHSLRPLVAQAKRQLEHQHPFDATLCHGIGGAAELFTLAFETTGLVEHQRAARFTAAACIKSKDINGGMYANGVPGGKKVPGLMVGDAGIGVMLMRMQSPGLCGSPLLAGCHTYRG